VKQLAVTVAHSSAAPARAASITVQIMPRPPFSSNKAGQDANKVRFSLVLISAGCTVWASSPYFQLATRKKQVKNRVLTHHDFGPRLVKEMEKHPNGS
jgi:hypothetical protein